MNRKIDSARAAPTPATREQISRWLDGDIEAHEIELAMTTLTQEEGRYCWAEMHLIGDCIRGLDDTPTGCAERIRAALASEPAIVAPAGKRLRIEQARHTPRGLAAAMTAMGRGGRLWATAAAVAAVGFVGTVVYHDQTTPAPVALAPAEARLAATQTEPLPADFVRAHDESAASLSPIRQYLRPVVSTQ